MVTVKDSAGSTEQRVCVCVQVWLVRNATGGIYLKRGATFVCFQVSFFFFQKVSDIGVKCIFSFQPKMSIPISKDDSQLCKVLRNSLRFTFGDGLL